MRDCMLDLETLDTAPTGIILSIGAVMFDNKGTGKEFYRTIDVQSCVDAGMTVSGGTFKFWMGQKGAARQALFENPAPLEEALKAFTAFLMANADKKTVRMWGNGSDFDCAMLQEAYRKVGMPAPWNFWNNRCVRTVRDVLNAPPIERVGEHHNALDDAKSQAQNILEILSQRGVW